MTRAADLAGICIRIDVQEITAEAISDTDMGGKAVLFCTGWDQHWRTQRYGDPDHPYLSGPGADLLIETGASLVGIDSVNIDDTRGGARPAHTKLLQAGIPIVEHLTGLTDLVGVPFRFYAVPAPVRGLGSFPVRAFALLP